MQPSGSMLAQVGTLVLATSGIQRANGFFGSFVSLRMVIEGFDPTMSSLVLSSYFAGFTLGAVRCGRIIERVGHIRAYAAFAGMVGAATASMPLLVTPVSWFILRAVIGFGCAGLFVTTESWLNAKVQPSARGRIFATYMVGTFMGLAFGQLLIARVALETATPFNVIIALFAIALVMVSATRAEPPQASTSVKLPMGQLLRAARVAVIGAALSGLISGAFYALAPVWMHGEGLSYETIGLVMLAAVLGGLALQIPIGRLSDRLDRRVVLAALSVGLACAAVILAHLPRSLPLVLFMAALFGGFMSTLYPVCVAHAHDRMPADRVVAVSSRLILMSGFGSVLGPLIGMGLMERFGIDGLLYMMAAAATGLAIVAAGRSLIAAAPSHLARPFAVLAPQATSLAHDPLDAFNGPPAPDRGKGDSGRPL